VLLVGSLQDLIRCVGNVHTPAFGLGRTGAGLGRIGYVFVSSQRLQGLPAGRPGAQASYLVGLLAQCCPGLETADKVGRTGQPQPLQRVCSEAGAVALIADDHDPPSGVVNDREPVGAGRIEPPLEHVSVNDDRSRKLTVAVPLIDRPCVNNKGARCHLPLKIRRINTFEPDAALK